MYVFSIQLKIMFIPPIYAQMRGHLFFRNIFPHHRFKNSIIWIFERCGPRWFQSSADTNRKYNTILFERDHPPQRHTNDHSVPARMSLYVLTENFIAQKEQEYNRSFGGSLIFLTFTTLPINLIWLCKGYLTRRLVLNAPSCVFVWESWYLRDHFNNSTEMILHLLSSGDD